MKKIDVYYQGEGLKDIQHVEVNADLEFAALKEVLIKKHGLDPGSLLFIENEDEPVDECSQISDRAGKCGIKAHVHRCRQIEVCVKFNGKNVEHSFGPGTTIARVKHWAAEKKFDMNPQEAGEHVLQLAGSHDRPAGGTHLGVLVHCQKCQLAFDLVPDERVNG